MAQEKLENLNIYYLDKTGECRKLETTVDGESLVFNINTLGCFGVVQQEISGEISNPDTDNTNTNSKNDTGVRKLSSPKTGDTANVLLYITILLLSAVILICGIVKRMKKE